MRRCQGPGAAATATGAQANVSSSRLDGRQDIPPPPRLQHLAEHIHALGPRPLCELLVELVAAHGDDVIQRLEAYGRIDPRLLRVMGGDRFPPRFAMLKGGRR